MSARAPIGYIIAGVDTALVVTVAQLPVGGKRCVGGVWAPNLRKRFYLEAI